MRQLARGRRRWLSVDANRGLRGSAPASFTSSGQGGLRSVSESSSLKRLSPFFGRPVDQSSTRGPCPAQSLHWAPAALHWQLSRALCGEAVSSSGDGGQPLWPSITNLGARHGQVCRAFSNVHHRADEVDANLLRSTVRRMSAQSCSFRRSGSRCSAG